MSRKTRGTRRELDAIELLETEGYTCVRSAASEGPVDIVAYGINHIRNIQVKSRETGVRPSERETAIEAMAHLPRLPGVSYEIWEQRKDGGRWTLTVIPA